MKSIVFLIFAVLTITSCSKEAVIGGGSTISETRTVSTFSNVRTEGSTNVEVVQGAQQNVRVTGYENLVPIYDTYVQNGTLVLKFDNHYYNVRNNNIQVTVTVPSINRVSINGSGDLEVRNFTGVNLSAEVHGSGNITANNGAFDKVLFKVIGSGRILATGIISKEAEAEISGSGKIDLNCTEKLTAKISGSGDLNFWGNPSMVVADISGSGKINRK